MRNQAAETIKSGAWIGFYCTSAAFIAALGAFTWSPRLLSFATAVAVSALYHIHAGITLTTVFIGDDVFRFREFWRKGERYATTEELFLHGCWNSCIAAICTGTSTAVVLYHLHLW